MKRRRRRSESAWRAALSRFAQSEVPAAEFCKRERICPSSFYRWRSMLGTSVSESVQGNEVAVVAQRPSSFMDLGTLSPTSTRCEVRLELRGGITLSLVRS